MPYHDPIPALKRQLGVELARFIADWSSNDVAAYLGTDRSRIAELRRGNLDRFSLEKLIRLATRGGLRVEIQLSKALRRLTPSGSEGGAR